MDSYHSQSPNEELLLSLHPHPCLLSVRWGARDSSYRPPHQRPLYMKDARAACEMTPPKGRSCFGWVQGKNGRHGRERDSGHSLLSVSQLWSWLSPRDTWPRPRGSTRKRESNPKESTLNTGEGSVLWDKTANGQTSVPAQPSGPGLPTEAPLIAFGGPLLSPLHCHGGKITPPIPLGAS